MAKQKRTLPVGANGEITLPPDALEQLGIEPGGSVEIFVDTRRKQIRIERHVDDPWADALKQKQEKGFEDLMGEQKDRDAAAERLFDEKSKEPPPKRKPEDEPGYWR